MNRALKNRMRSAFAGWLDVPPACLRAYLRLPSKTRKRLFSVPGMSRTDRMMLFQWSLQAPTGAVAVEVGSYLGSSSCIIATGLKNRARRFYCVDTWQNDAMSEGARDTYDAFCQNTKPWADFITPLRKESTEAAAEFTDRIDFLFIDGDHSYDGCRKDVDAWFPHLNAAAVVVFHDFPNAPGVTRVVAELMDQNKIKPLNVRGHCLACIIHKKRHNEFKEHHI